MHNALERDRHFDRLWLAVEHLPYLAKVIPAEREDLLEGDIPMFTTRPSSRDICSSSHQRIADFLDEPGMVVVQRRLQQLSDQDCAQQLWLIRASVTTLFTDAERMQAPAYHLNEPQTIADREQLLAAARAVGDRLEALALRGKYDISWIGLTLTPQEQWSLEPLGTDLYDGLPGVALFLAYLGAITEEIRYTTLAQAALKTLRDQVKHSQSFITSIGGFEGWGGIIYTLTHLGVLWGESALLAEAEDIVELLPSLIEGDEALDVISGVAGCIGSLLGLYACSPSQHTLAAAIQCGDRLLNATPKQLTGFSHGAAGVAWTLLELAALTNEERFQTEALTAIDYERSLFCSEAANWPDLRASNDGQQTFMTAWCHGAPGIGLARLRSLQHIDDMAIRAEIETALKTTLAQGFGFNHSLCHGDLGNLELLLQASVSFDDPQWGSEVKRLAGIILDSIRQHGWLCGNPLGVESPGLMTGLAGIGYGLLRLAQPERVPSVLVLAPPNLYSKKV